MIKILEFTAASQSHKETLDQHLKDGWNVVHIGTTAIDGATWYNIILQDGEGAASANGADVELDAIVSVEGAETFSKSHEKQFHFFRCKLASGRRVNIFDHPEDSRNTYKIVKDAGWDVRFPDVDILMEFERPIPCQVVDDGEWLSLKGVMSLDTYREHYEAPVEAAGRDDTREIPDVIIEPADLLIPGKSKAFGQFISTLAQDDFLILDTETTDLYGEIIEVSIIDSKGEVVLDTLVKPNGTISEGARKVHGITDEMVKDAPTWHWARKMIAAHIDGRPLVIYNSGYDIGRLQHTDKAHGLVEDHDFWFDLPSSLHCAMEAYAEHNGNWNDYHGSYTWVKLGDAAVTEGVSLNGTHRALADCKLTLGVCKSMLVKYLSESA